MNELYTVSNKSITDYYPNTATQQGYKYQYNGQELQDELVLNWTAMDWRNYDPAIGRWMSPDPLSEEFSEWSPYNYAMNNPIYFIDPNGMAADDWYKDSAGNYVYDSTITSQNDLDDAGIDGEYLGETVNYSPFLGPNFV